MNPKSHWFCPSAWFTYRSLRAWVMQALRRSSWFPPWVSIVTIASRSDQLKIISNTKTSNEADHFRVSKFLAIYAISSLSLRGPSAFALLFLMATFSYFLPIQIRDISPRPDEPTLFLPAVGKQCCPSVPFCPTMVPTYMPTSVSLIPGRHHEQFKTRDN